MVERQQKKIKLDEALVIGGGVAGLTAARVLSDYFTKVTILERGSYPDNPSFRKATPQARHRHGLSEEGRKVFGKLFPGLDTSLKLAGCPAVRSKSVAELWHVDYVVSQDKEKISEPSDTSLQNRVINRPRFEWEIYQCVTQIENVEILQRCKISEWVYNKDKKQVEQVIARVNGNKKLELFSPDLIVEARGRHSKIMNWLRTNNIEPPSESILNSNLMMVSCQYEMPKDLDIDWAMLFIKSRPPYNFREAFLTCIENQYLLLTMSGTKEFHPPTKSDELLNYLQKLRKPGIYDILKNLKQISPIYGYMHTQNRRRYFENLTDFPHNLIVIGDAVCCFNPAYGFGMGVAGQASEVLQEVLDKSELIDFSHQFHKELGRVLDSTWQRAVTMDRNNLHQLENLPVRTPLQLPLQKEAHIVTWQNYSKLAKQNEAFTILRQRLVQLQFPVCKGISKTKAYREATLRGVVNNNLFDSHLDLQEPHKLDIIIYESMTGMVPILQTSNRVDFEKLVQALAKRNEPVIVPDHIKAYYVSNLNNWDRVRAYKLTWMEQNGLTGGYDKSSLAVKWQAEFQNLIAQKELYQDSFMIAESWIQSIPADEMCLPKKKWHSLSDILHKEYVSTYYFLMRLALAKRNISIHNDLIAYYVALVKSLGEVRLEWFSRLLNPNGLEVDYSESMGIDEQRKLLNAAITTVVAFDREFRLQLRDPDGIALAICALDSLTFEELAANNALYHLKRMFEHSTFSANLT